MKPTPVACQVFYPANTTWSGTLPFHAATVQGRGDFLTGLIRHTGESRYPGILATLGFYSLITVQDSGLRWNDASQGKATHQL